MLNNIPRSELEGACAILGINLAVLKTLIVCSIKTNAFEDKRLTILYDRSIFFREYLNLKTNEAKIKVKLENPNLEGSLLDAKIAEASRGIMNDIHKLIQLKPEIINMVSGGNDNQDYEYTRLEKASEINKECALKSCRYGEYLINGYNYDLLGYKDVTSLVNDLKKSEVSQFKVFIKYVLANKSINNSLKEKNWDKLAKLLTGPNKSSQLAIRLVSCYNTFVNNSHL